MRQWKIRTKMIAGLSGLALVIGLLVFSGWTQSSQHRELADDIKQLADAITHAHIMHRSAEDGQAALRRIRDFKEQNDGRSLSLVRFNEFGFESDILENVVPKIRPHLEDLTDAVHFEGHNWDSSSLLVDTKTRTQQLKRIDHALNEYSAAWNKMNGRKADVSEDILFREKLDRLVDSTKIHLESIQNGMKSFPARVYTEQRAKRNWFYGYTGLAAFLILFLAWSFWTWIVVPFRTLFRGSELIAAGHHKHKILLGTDDEIGVMAETVNNITDRFNAAVDDATRARLHAEQEVRDRTRELIRNERLASVGFLAAGVAHEINNPLGVIAWTAEALESTVEDLPEEQKRHLDDAFLAELAESLSQVQSEAFRCKGITRRLLDFSRLGDSSRAEEDLGELVERVASLVSKVGEYRCKTLQIHCDTPVIAYCNAQEIQQVVLNLVSNALESVDTDGRVDVFVRYEADTMTGNRHATVVVQDDGCGMSQDVLDHLFEPFFTRRRDNTGTGLGLSISSRIVSMHHGFLTPYSDGEGKGSRLVLRLPEAKSDIESYPSKVSFESENELPSSTEWNLVEKAA